MDNGRKIFADSVIYGQDLEELLQILAPPRHFVGFTGRGGGSGGTGGPGGGGGDSGPGAGPVGLQGLEGLIGAGFQGFQGIQGFQGTNPGFQGPTGPDPEEMIVSSGTYTGDGNATQLVTTGLSFPIEMLWIHVIGPDANIPAPVVIFKPGTVAGQTAGFLQLDADTEFSNEDVVEMTANDFTVHLGVGDKSANNLGTTYHWVAITKPSGGGLDDATFFYPENNLVCNGGGNTNPYGNSSAPYNWTLELDCSDFTDTEAATITGVPGGTFTITPSGAYPNAQINAANGVLTLDFGTNIGFYVIRYTTPAGPNQNFSEITIQLRDDG